MGRRERDPQKTRTGIRIHYEIPSDLHRRAKAEAALRGLTLKDFVIDVLEKAVSGRSTHSARNRRNLP
jgi:predicted HicB family RNase H-like nuclease